MVKSYKVRVVCDEVESSAEEVQEGERLLLLRWCAGEATAPPPVPSGACRASGMRVREKPKGVLPRRIFRQQGGSQ
jgi:hypothetical protein